MADMLARTLQSPLTLDTISHSYGNGLAADDVTLEVHERELISLVGPSGCQLHIAAGNTLLVARCATVIVSILGVAAAVGLAGIRGASARALENGFLGPLVLPTLAYGFAALMFFSLLGVRPSLPLLVIGHAVVVAPFVFRTTSASLTQLDSSVLESSASLGAGRFTRFVQITLPSSHRALRSGHSCRLSLRSTMCRCRCSGRTPVPRCCRFACVV